MSQSFGMDVATIEGFGIEAGLDVLSRPPDWLVAIEDPERLRADLESAIPELASGGDMRLVKCKFKRARIEGHTWSSLCRLSVEDADGIRDVDVRGTLVPLGVPDPPRRRDGAPFPTDGWHCFLPTLRWEFTLEPPDATMPALSLLTDPDRSRTILEDALRAGANGLDDLRIVGCVPTVKRYREGRRCAIRYAFEYGPDRRAHWPDGVLAKVYEGEEARATFDGMRALWASPLRTSRTVTIAEPLAHLPDVHVLVQGLVPGDRSLKEHIKTSFADGLRPGIEMLAGPVRKAGRVLAELHASKATSGPVVTWDDQVEGVRIAGTDLSHAVPAMADALEPLTTRLETLARVTPAGPLVPTHRSFRPAQLLVAGDGLALIDFDGFCQAEAGLDLSLFRTTLVDLCLRALDDGQPMDLAEQRACQAELDELCMAFLEGYEEVGEVSRPRLALWDVLTGAKDILDCWRKIKFEHLDRRMEFLRMKLGTEELITAHRGVGAPHARA